MTNQGRTTGPHRRPSAGLRDLILIAAVAAVVFLIGMASDLFGRMEVWIDREDPRGAAALMGLLFLLMLSTGFLAVLRWRQARRSESLMTETEERFRALVEQAPSVVYSWNPRVLPGQPATEYVSPQIERLLGCSADEWVGEADLWVRMLHPDDRERVIAASAASDRDGTPFREEYRCVARDGRTVWVRDESVPVARDGRGRPLRMQGVMYDITPQKEAEARLHEAEERFRTIVERVPAVAYTWDGADRPGSAPAGYISPQIRHLIGYEPQAWLDDPELWTRRTHPDDVPAVLAAWDRAVAADAPFTAEYRMHTTDDRWIWVRDEAVPVAAGTRGRSVYQGVVFDITEQRRIQDQLVDAEARYRTLVEQVPVAVYIDAVDELSTARYISPRYEQLTGYTPEQRMADPGLWANMLHPDDRERVLEESERTNRTGDPFDVEYRIVRADGRVVWLHDHAFLVDGPEGAPAWQGALTDITERRIAEEALASRDRILSSAGYAAERFLDTEGWERCIDDVLCHLGRAGNARRAFVFRNERGEDGERVMVRAHEWHEDAAQAPPTTRPDHPYRAGGFARWEELLSAGEVIHGPVRGYPASEREHLEARGIGSCIVAPISAGGDWWGFIGFDHADERSWQPAEIDALRVAANTLGGAIARERDAERLSEAEARYRGLIETIPAATYIDTVDALSQAVYMSPQVLQIYGYTPQEWRERPELWEQGLHPDDRDEVIARVQRHLHEGVPYEAEYRFRHRDGRWIWCHDESVMIRDEQGNPRFSQGVVFDITAQKQHEDQLREAEERFRGIVEHVPSAIYLDNADGSMETLYISPQIEEIAGVTQEEWLTQPDLWLRLVDPDDRDEVTAGYLSAAASGRSWSAEYRMHTRDGRTIWIHDETTFLHDEEGNPTYLQGVISDITERRLAEQALRESEQREREAAERLRALDEMKNTFLAAVSHELRSPLTSILGLSLTLERTPHMEADDREDLLARLSSNARKLDRLLKDLLDIDRLNRGIVEPQYRTVDVGALGRRTVESLEALAERTVLVEAPPVSVTADPAKVERIVENLLMNAARHTTPDRRIWLRIEPHDAGVLIAVEDDGPGVPGQLREAIFEPFRQGPTASPHSPGTGIGLSLVASFAELHGGRAWVQEREGGGASFRVFIPDRAGLPAETSEQPSARERVLGETG